MGREKQLFGYFLGRQSAGYALHNLAFAGCESLIAVVRLMLVLFGRLYGFDCRHEEGVLHGAMAGEVLLKGYDVEKNRGEKVLVAGALVVAYEYILEFL